MTAALKLIDSSLKRKQNIERFQAKHMEETKALIIDAFHNRTELLSQCNPAGFNGMWCVSILDEITKEFKAELKANNAFNWSVACPESTVITHGRAWSPR